MNCYLQLNAPTKTAMLTVETGKKIFDLVISRGQVQYFYNSASAVQLPKTPSVKQLDKLYSIFKDEIDDYLQSPTNEKWWDLTEKFKTTCGTE